MKSENNSNHIHVFRVNRAAAARIREPPNPSTTSLTVNSRTSLSAETKRLICEDHINNPKYTQEALASKYGCKRTTIAKIIKSKDRWLSIDSDAAIAKRFRQRSSRYPIVENALVLWLQKEHSDITVVTDQMLRCQARQYAQAFHVDGLEDFKASSSWVSNFKQRYMTPKLRIENNTPPTLMIESSGQPIPTTSPSDIQMQEVNNDRLLTSGQVTFDTSVAPVLAIAPPPTENNSNQSPILEATAASPHVENTTTTEVNNLAIEWTLPPTDSNGNLDIITTSNQTQSVVEAVASNDNTEEDDEIVESFDREDSFITPVDDIMDDNYEDNLDMMDHCDDMNSPCFDNSEAIVSSPRDNNNTQEQPAVEQDTNLLEETEQPIIVDNLATTSTDNNTTTLQENTKLSAKQHLEAALAFYTSQNNKNNTSMYADMIKLILQNDF